MLQDIGVEQLIEELPSREPRFILHSHELKHADGRVQYPLNLILYIPDGCGTNNRFTYASTANAVSASSGITRVCYRHSEQTKTNVLFLSFQIIELREDISAEWLSKELAKTY